MARPSASKLHLLDLCAYWAREDVPSDPRQQNKYSDKGNAFHAMVEADGEERATGGDATAPTADKANRLMDGLSVGDRRDVGTWVKAWRASEWSKVPWEHEAPFAFDTATGTARRLPKDAGGRGDYRGLKPTEIPGTPDLFYFDGTLLTVADLKTGWQADREHVAENAQLRFLAMTIARALGAEAARTVVLDVGPEVQAEDAALDSLDLGAIASTVTARFRRIPASTPQPGAHCSDLYCPALGNCPATKALAATAAQSATEILPKEAAPELLAKFRLELMPTSDAHAAWTRYAITTFRDLLDRAEVGLKGYAEQRGGLDLGNGKVWTRTDVAMESIALDGPTGAEAEQILHDAGVSDAIERTSKASKEAIREAIREREGLKGKALDARLEEILVLLRRINATKQWQQSKWAEKAAKTKKAG